MAQTIHERIECAAHAADRVREQVSVRAVDLLDARGHEARELDSETPAAIANDAKVPERARAAVGEPGGFERGCV
jgi:hypothetical protein